MEKCCSGGQQSGGQGKLRCLMRASNISAGGSSLANAARDRVLGQLDTTTGGSLVTRSSIGILVHDSITCLLASLDGDVFEALVLVKKMGTDVREGQRRQFNYIDRLLREVEPDLMDALIQAMKDGDHNKLQTISNTDWIMENDDEELDDAESEAEGQSDYIDTTSRWFEGLINKDEGITKEVYSIHSVEFDRQGWTTIQMTRDSAYSRGYMSARSVTDFLSDVYPAAADEVGKSYLIADEKFVRAQGTAEPTLTRGDWISRVADQAKRRLVTTSEPVKDCYDIFLSRMFLIWSRNRYSLKRSSREWRRWRAWSSVARRKVNTNQDHDHDYYHSLHQQISPHLRSGLMRRDNPDMPILLILKSHLTLNSAKMVKVDVTKFDRVRYVGLVAKSRSYKTYNYNLINQEDPTSVMTTGWRSYRSLELLFDYRIQEQKEDGRWREQKEVNIIRNTQLCNFS
ncbi:hypothetical protein Syun_013859 [Stephania yunnanensis]|uniref:Uncharacterized protein n=1 Tax=Stephania yunnanensis TaxID=152371 RepID=A0AAP0P917_9MAGN